MTFASIAVCMDLREEHIAEAATSSSAMHALLARFEQIAVPARGAPLVLAALARLGTTACDWLDGELTVELTAEGAETVLTVSQTIGGGFREKVFRNFRFRVPLTEFSRGIQLRPKLIEPLSLRESERRIVLSATSEVRRTSLPPPMVAIDPSCFEPVGAVKLTIPYLSEPTGPAAPPPTAASPKPRSATVIGLQDRTPRAPQKAPGGPKIVVRRRDPKK